MTKSMLHRLVHILLASALVILSGCGSAQRDADQGNEKIAEMRQLERELRAENIQIESHTQSAYVLLQMDARARKSAEAKLARFVSLGREALALGDRPGVTMKNRKEIKLLVDEAEGILEFSRGRAPENLRRDRRQDHRPESVNDIDPDGFWKSYHSSYAYVRDNEVTFDINIVEFDSAKDSRKLKKLSRSQRASLVKVAAKAIAAMKVIIDGRQKLGHPDEVKSHKAQLERLQALRSALD